MLGNDLLWKMKHSSVGRDGKGGLQHLCSKLQFWLFPGLTNLSELPSDHSFLKTSTSSAISSSRGDKCKHHHQLLPAAQLHQLRKQSSSAPAFRAKCYANIKNPIHLNSWHKLLHWSQHHSQTPKAFCQLPGWKLRSFWSCLNASILSPIISQVFTELPSFVSSWTLNLFYFRIRGSACKCQPLNQQRSLTLQSLQWCVRRKEKSVCATRPAISEEKRLFKEGLNLTTIQSSPRCTKQKKSEFRKSGQCKETTSNFNCCISCLAVCLKTVTINSGHMFHTS